MRSGLREKSERTNKKAREMCRAMRAGRGSTHAAPPLVQLPPYIQIMTGSAAVDCNRAAAGAKTLR
jgi:hypothetical protein